MKRDDKELTREQLRSLVAGAALDVYEAAALGMSVREIEFAHATLSSFIVSLVERGDGDVVAIR